MEEDVDGGRRFGIKQTRADTTKERHCQTDKEHNARLRKRAEFKLGAGETVWYVGVR